MTPDTIQKELPALMGKYNVKPEYLATKLGLSFYTIRSWIEGTRKPNQFTITRIEQIFNGFRIAQERK